MDISLKEKLEQLIDNVECTTSQRMPCFYLNKRICDNLADEDIDTIYETPLFHLE